MLAQFLLEQYGIGLQKNCYHINPIRPKIMLLGSARLQLLLFTLMSCPHP